MFNADDIQKRLKDAPFIPVRIVTSSGESYDVTHPDLVWVSKRWIMVGKPSNSRPGQIDDASRVAILHITDLQDISQPPIAGANGPPAKGGG
jgi:hypothetical protein